jgi:hypothetical protein
LEQVRRQLDALIAGKSGVTRLSPVETKWFEPEHFWKRLVVVGVHPMPLLIAKAHAPEPFALDNDTLANRGQNRVNDCRHFVL